MYVFRVPPPALTSCFDCFSSDVKVSFQKGFYIQSTYYVQGARCFRGRLEFLHLVTVHPILQRKKLRLVFMAMAPAWVMVGQLLLPLFLRIIVKSMNFMG